MRNLRNQKLNTHKKKRSFWALLFMKRLIPTQVDHLFLLYENWGKRKAQRMVYYLKKSVHMESFLWYSECRQTYRE